MVQIFIFWTKLALNIFSGFHEFRYLLISYNFWNCNVESLKNARYYVYTLNPRYWDGKPQNKPVQWSSVALCDNNRIRNQQFWISFLMYKNEIYRMTGAVFSSHFFLIGWGMLAKQGQNWYTFALQWIRHICISAVYIQFVFLKCVFVEYRSQCRYMVFKLLWGCCSLLNQLLEKINVC